MALTYPEDYAEQDALVSYVDPHIILYSEMIGDGRHGRRILSLSLIFSFFARDGVDVFELAGYQESCLSSS